MARVYDPVMQWVRREQAQFNLNGRDRMDCMSFADRVCAHLAQADATDLAFLDQFGQDLDGVLDGYVGINSRAFEDVDGLGPVQYFESVLHRSADGFGTSVRTRPHVVGAFYAQYDFAGVFGILFEVAFDKMQ